MTRIKVPTVGPILKGQRDENSIGIWLRGKEKSRLCCYGVVKVDNNIKIERLHRFCDWTQIFLFENLVPGRHTYQAGFFHSTSPDLFSSGVPDMDLDVLPLHQFFISGSQGEDNGNRGSDRSDNRSDSSDLEFVFGSCRRLISIAGINCFGTGLDGDQIYRAIRLSPSIASPSITNINKTLDFVLNVGDKVYFDPVPWQHYKSLGEKRGLYRKVYNFPEQKLLYSQVPAYDICDDHDLQENDCGQRTRERHPDRFHYGLCAYLEYQHIDGCNDLVGLLPREKMKYFANIELYYDFCKKGAYFFVMDTRSKRCELEDPPTIISERQEEDFKKWIQDPAKRGKLKFIVTSVPLLSQNSPDSWFGFPQQQRRILELILGTDRDGHPIDRAVVLTGDAHCARVGVYSIFRQDRYVRSATSTRDRHGQLLGHIPEILSSGLVAINHDQGKMLTRFNLDLMQYNRDNDFPYILNNTVHDGVKIVTQFSSPCFPQPASPERFVDKIRIPFGQMVDNVFVKIRVSRDNCPEESIMTGATTNCEKLEIEIINQDGLILHSLFL